MQKNRGRNLWLLPPWRGQSDNNVIGSNVPASIIGGIASSPRRALTLGATLILVLLVAVGASIWSERSLAVRSAGRELAQLLASPAETTRDWLNSADQALAEDAAHLRGIMNGVALLGSDESVREFREILIQQAAQLSAISGIAVFNGHGQMIVASRFNGSGTLIANPNLWRQELHGKPENQTVLVGPARSVLNGQPRYFLARHLLAPDGSEAALIVASINLPEILATLRAIAVEGRKVIVTRPDGRVVASLPTEGAEIPAAIRADWSDAVAKGGASFTTTAGLAHERWLVAVRGSSDSRLVFTAIEPVRDVLIDQRRGEDVILIVSFGAAAGIGILLYLLVNALRKVERQTGELQQSLEHDFLTGLPNRAAFVARMERALAQTGPIALHLLDLDRFKIINDTRGHSIGDALLVAVAHRLTEAVRSADLVARLGGDEFVIVQADCKVYADVEALASRIVECLARPFFLDQHIVSIGVSIGIACRPEDGESWRELMRKADIAMYRAKENGRSMFRRYHAAMDGARQAHFELEQDLRTAIRAEQFHLAYQPICRIADAKLVGFEALVRWDHPSRGAISPAQFIRIAEGTGGIIPLGAWIVRNAFAAAARWPDDLNISVNISSKELQEVGFVDRISRVLGQAELRPERVILEITETALLEGEDAVLDVMNQLRSSGIRFALDDFGTGHAGLSYLHRFPFDRIKIDQSFVHGLGLNNAAEAIVETTLTLSRRLGLEVVAEGVETTAQVQMLKALGCTLIQGYLVGRPMLIPEVTSFATRFRAQNRS